MLSQEGFCGLLNHSFCNADWEMYYDNLSQSSWKYPVHEGILGHCASPRVSECLVGVSTLGFRDKGYHLLHKSNQPYRPPRPYQVCLILHIFSWYQCS